MKTKYIFKTLALAMLMPAMLLTTACSNEDDAVNNTENIANKGYALPVTVNVTRQGDEATTRATYNATNKKLEFSEGDKLFVSGNDKSAGGAGQFAGTLTWVSGGTFSGTIYTENPYSGTIDALFTAGKAKAYLLPADYNTYHYLSITGGGSSASLSSDIKNAFATSKATAVEQFSYEYGNYTSGTGFALSPFNAILNFTITGLANNADVDVVFSKGYTISQTLTSDGEGVITFAVGVFNTDLKDCALTVGGKAITLVNSSKTLSSGKIYNITRIIGALSGRFSVSSNKQVYFSQGNLQATWDGTSWSWAFAANQWDYIGNNAGNTSINGNGTIDGTGTVDLFCWVGASSNWTGAAQYGITNSTATNNQNGYGNSATEALKSDWGTLIGSGWRTLTKDEWKYLLEDRATTSGRYAKAKVNNVPGIILLPDDWSTSFHSLNSINTENGGYTDNDISSAAWASDFEAHGAVFLPTAGYRELNNDSQVIVIDDGISGSYWSSSYYTEEHFKSYCMTFDVGSLYPDDRILRYKGLSVRLVYE